MKSKLSANNYTKIYDNNLRFDKIQTAKELASDVLCIETSSKVYYDYLLDLKIRQKTLSYKNNKLGEIEECKTIISKYINYESKIIKSLENKFTNNDFKINEEIVTSEMVSRLYLEQLEKLEVIVKEGFNRYWNIVNDFKIKSIE